ncbi:MAG: hypothetical protein NVSMB22_18580 [Chloroflexota bacterium]
MYRDALHLVAWRVQNGPHHALRRERGEDDSLIGVCDRSTVWHDEVTGPADWIPATGTCNQPR